jgi:hypothetical protein
MSQTNHTQGSHGNIAGKGGRARDDPIGTAKFNENIGKSIISSLSL